MENFVNSKEFQNYEVVPISAIRAQSYLANPHALPDDIVLYLGLINNKLVAFRSLFADTLNSDGQQIVLVGAAEHGYTKYIAEKATRKAFS